MLVETLFCSFFNPIISLYIYYDQYEKIWRQNKNKNPAARFHGNSGHIRFGGTYNFKTAASTAVKSCIHIEDIQMKKRTEVFLLLLHNQFLIIFCVKNTTKIREHFRFCLGEKIHNTNNKALFQAHTWPIICIFSSTCRTCASGLCHRYNI